MRTILPFSTWKYWISAHTLSTVTVPGEVSIMQASMVASFIVFVMTGVYTFFYSRPRFLSSDWVAVLICSSFFMTACYFFYFEDYTEWDLMIRQKLKSVGVWEWVLRVVAQIELFSLWFFLQLGWMYFLSAFVCLYLTFLLWDCITWDTFEDHYLACLDFIGALLSVILFTVLAYLLNDPPIVEKITQVEGKVGLAEAVATNSICMVLLGIVITGYSVILLASMFKVRHNPFKNFHDKRF